MSQISVLLDHTKESEKYVYDLKYRLEKKDLFLNPFNSFIKFNFFYDGKIFLYVNLKTIYPHIYLIGLIPILAVFIFKGFYFNWISFLGLFILCFGFFWSPLFFIFALKKGLRNAGYKGKIRILSSKEALKRVVENAV